MLKSLRLGVLSQNPKKTFLSPVEGERMKVRGVCFLGAGFGFKLRG